MQIPIGDMLRAAKIEKAARITSGAYLTCMINLGVLIMSFAVVNCFRYFPWLEFMMTAIIVIDVVAGFILLWSVLLSPAALFVGISSIVVNKRLGLPSSRNGITTVIIVLVYLLACGIIQYGMPFQTSWGSQNENPCLSALESDKKPEYLDIVLSPEQQNIVPQKPISIRIEYTNTADTELLIGRFETAFPNMVLCTPSGEKIVLVPAGPESDIVFSDPNPFLYKATPISCTVDLRNFVIEKEVPDTEREHYQFLESGTYYLYMSYYPWVNANRFDMLTRDQYLKMPPSSNVVILRR